MISPVLGSESPSCFDMQILLFLFLMRSSRSCGVGVGADRREDEAAARSEDVPGKHHQSSHPAETHALL